MSALEEIRRYVEDISDETVKIARNIWEYAELSYTETKSAKELEDALEKEGFRIEKGIADIPTAFLAEYRVGTGRPVMGFLGEYDALDGLSQKAGQPSREAVTPGGCGHGCGHNLLGAGCFAAAVAVKNYLLNNGIDGTVIYYGCPAEEGAGSKQFIARAGYFDGVDFAYTWHPNSRNEVSGKSSVAIMGANFIFDGIASHAGGAPHLGRSALDAVELMNVGCNYLREHMIDQARVHYAYSDAGGTAPNVVQSHAVIKYEVRAPKVNQMQELFTRVVDIAKGAALMTGTTMNYEITMAFSDYIQNKTLAPVMSAALEEAGPPAWTDEDYRLAGEFFRTYPKSTQLSILEQLEEYIDPDEIERTMRDRPLDSVTRPFDPKETRYESGSTDVGDVGYAVPTVTLHVATAGLGNVGHSWQNTALSNSPIGIKGMLKAAEVMALAAAETIGKPELIEKAKQELLRKNGGAYKCPLPEYVQPPIGRY
ncbi:MAG: amidohydrolase [Oscillospiraceae bacterium]|nr:amidohydrolase [Oscillospiraceae bacterium]MBR5979301.1 amidohydrolase [Oscillospiraceae bacterium]